jgi:tripartite ATP-independent periplasmic transporter solute receptor, DctP family
MRLTTCAQYAATAVCGLVLALGLSDTALAAKYVIKAAYENNTGEPFDQSMREWARLFKERTNGEGEIRVFPSSQLGSKKDVMEQMQMGAALVTVTDGAFLADFGIPDFSIMLGPYLGRSPEEMAKLAETPWFKGLNKQLDDKGLHVLASNWFFGRRHILAKKPVHSPADLAGLKIRVPNTKIQIAGFEAMGATPTPMPWAEVYPALTTGVVDGAENAIPVMYGQKLHEQAKYLILSGHVDLMSQIVCGTKYFNKLPADIQKALTDTCLEAGLFQTDLIQKVDNEYIDKMKTEGVTVIEVDREQFAKAAEGAYGKFPDWTPNLYETLQKELGR